MSEPLSLETPTGTLYGTLELPAGSGPFPLALILCGSGPTDRDGNNPMAGRNDSLKLLAEGLAARGIASLRYDKRGVGQSAPASRAVSTDAALAFRTEISDAAGWLEKLAQDRRFSRRVVIGHSQGSLTGMLALEQARADGFVSLEGAGRNVAETLEAQLAPQLPAPLMEKVRATIAELRSGRPVQTLDPALQAVPPVAALFAPALQPYLLEWMKYDPAAELARLSLPTLVVQGTHDLQVPVSDARRLAEGNPRARLAVVEGMNHVLKAVPADPQANLASYRDPSLPLAPQLADLLAGFIRGL